jgi:hypothetical protein
MNPLSQSQERKRRKADTHAQSGKLDSDFASQDFIRELQTRIAEHYFKPSTRKSGGERFPKGITSDPFFRAIRYCQKWQHDIETLRNLPLDVREPTKETTAALEKIRLGLLEHYQSQHKPELEQLIGCEFVNAAVQRNIERLQHLVDLCALHKERLEDLDMKYYPPPWHYFIGVAACLFLARGGVPYKKDVKEAAILHRAVFDAQMRAQVGGAAKRPILFEPISLEPELKRLTKELKRSGPNWTRIFGDLGLSGLPAAPTHSVR